MSVMFSRGDKLESGHYTVIKEIGVGGMGVVYHCRDEQLMRDVAMKMLLPELMADKANLDVFHQEARLAAQLEHPNVVTVYDIGVEEKHKKQHHYVCMEYLPGGNLANRVISGPLAVEHCLNWMKQLASGLTYAHKRGVVHQDIKADNIFITNEGDLKIGDFGLARLLVGRVHYNAQTKGMGTPAYMSPELCRGEPQDHRSDIYSLGVLFFEMATGQLPFKARGMIEMATKHSSAPIPSSKRINPLVPEILDKVIRRMMAKTPEERYSTMSEVLTILDDLIFELRVARLGLGNRPMMRSGNVQAELLAHAQAQAQMQAPGVVPVSPEIISAQEARAPQTPAPDAAPVGLSRDADTWKTETARKSLTRADTEPHTTSLPPLDPSVAKKLSSNKAKALLPSEQLIAQLEDNVTESPKSPASMEADSPRPTPRSFSPGHFVRTTQVHPPGSLAADPESEPKPADSESDTTDEAESPKASIAESVPPEFSSDSISSRVRQALNQSPPPFVSSAFSVPAKPPDETKSPPPVPETVQLEDFTPTPESEPMSLAPPSTVREPVIEIDVAQTLQRDSVPSPTPAPTPIPASAVPTTPAPCAPALKAPEWTPPAMKAVTDAPRVPKIPPRTPAGAGRTTSSKLPKMRHGPLMLSLKNELQLRWIFSSKGPIGWASAPVLDKEEAHIFVSSADGRLYCVDTGSGEAKWSCNVGAPLLSSPVLSGDKVLVASSNGLICGLNARDGSMLWRLEAHDSLVATPALMKDILVVPTMSGKVMAVETQGGLQRWHYKAEAGVVGSPQALGNLVLFGTKNGDLHAVSTDAGEKVWKFAGSSPIAASPAASVDSIYFGTEGGIFYALDAERGRLIWEYPTERAIVSKAVISFTSVLFCSHDKWLYCCERYDGGLRWKGALKGKVMANLVATRDTALSVTREGWIQAFSTNTGEVRWQRDLGRSLESSPVLTTDHLYLSTVEGEVVAYSFASPTVLAEKSA